ncbi:uncharacterized protein EI97DRAFT_260195 [Westerdykella ornata]|uniref:Uncharacterized protein n=1 Tax=Westerdykella ornata TaxID=318751 RepID=A0A6A6J5K7_WESOR|nr:uncharacterized protein EI97DRAFT_260195 [Westerdykella ornata]KAF2271715.1 hypothetical protein EI97DRAFT_260195 [Westerdykella ornata]
MARYISALTLLAIGAHAVDVENYGSRNCGAQQIGGCYNLAPSTCCQFRDSYRTLEGLELRVGTGSVKFRNLQQCDIGSWFRPANGRACGSAMATAIGPLSSICLSGTGTQQRRDGAMWYHLATDLFNCPKPGLREAQGNPEYKVALDQYQRGLNLVYGTDVKFPAGWGAISKRSVAGRTTYEVSHEDLEKRAPACNNIQYADTYFWVGDESVYVLKGSKEVHDALAHYGGLEEPKPSYEEYIKSLGAKFYKNYRDYENLGPNTENQCRVNKRDFPVVEAEPAPPGASGTPMVFVD